MASGVSPGPGNKKADVRDCFLFHALSVAGGLGAFPQHMSSFPLAGQDLRLNGIITEHLSRVLTGPYANVNEYRMLSVPSTPGLNETLDFLAFIANIKDKTRISLMD